jgi:hypothetical protein
MMPPESWMAIIGYCGYWGITFHTCPHAECLLKLLWGTAHCRPARPNSFAANFRISGLQPIASLRHMESTDPAMVQMAPLADVHVFEAISDDHFNDANVYIVFMISLLHTGRLHHHKAPPASDFAQSTSPSSIIRGCPSISPPRTRVTQA